MKINDAIFGAILTILGIVVLVYVQRFPTIPGQQYGPALFPGVISVGFVICGVMLVLSGLRERRSGPWFEAGAWMRSSRHVRAVAAIILGTAAYIGLAEPVGFLIISPILLFIWFIALGVRSTTAIVAAVITTLVIWYAFYKLLRVPLPWGVLTRFAF